MHIENFISIVKNIKRKIELELNMKNKINIPNEVQNINTMIL